MLLKQYYLGCLMRLGRVGFDRVVGYLANGAQALAARPDPVRCMARRTPAELATQLPSPTPPIVLDGRTVNEHHDKYIDGSLHIPLNRLKRQLDEIPPARPVAIHCANGYRSAIAAGILTQHGRTEVSDLIGGRAAWKEAGFDVIAAAV